MPTIFRYSYAKLNLHLHVKGRRADGYHELETIFQEIDLFDEVNWTLRPEQEEITLSCPSVPGETHENLIVRAADLFCKTFSVPRGMHFDVIKNIPCGAGLGGGSSNAAVALLILAEYYEKKIESLYPLAKSLGADVPFFLNGGCALGIERGDEVIPLAINLSQKFVLVCPNVHVETRKVFSRMKDFLTSKSKHGIKLHPFFAKKLETAKDGLYNDLEEATFFLYPELKDVKQQLCKISSGLVQMSGSGSTFFIVVSTHDEGCKVLDLVRQQGFNGYLSKPIVRGLNSRAKGA